MNPPHEIAITVNLDELTFGDLEALETGRGVVAIMRKCVTVAGYADFSEVPLRLAKQIMEAVREQLKQAANPNG